ncbi:hypothetical protein RUM44_004868 [Polyplax serrata]|uniref:APCDD1 domain-containing protein n=1 Tax=Polyplax serrata TaxID=468196 RepID=A0ABR1B5X3_POLSC
MRFWSNLHVSECEIRPGPEFLLRSYTFMKNNSFRLLQHFYEDESCILPVYTVIAKGSLTLKESSWMTPSGTEFHYSLSRVTIIPHTTEASEKLYREKKLKCFHGVRKTWKPHKEYVVYNNSEDVASGKTRRKYRGYTRRRKTNKNVDCLSAVGVTFNELMLIRTQWRPVDGNKRNRELLLGDMHSRRVLEYKPTAFQTPLLEVDHAHDCVNCRMVAKGTERAPPHLISKPQLPPLPHGQWVSRRCEVRPLGMFLTRRLSFDSRDRSWMAEYKFHADPFCTESSFAISSSGKYHIEPVHNKERYVKRRKTGTNLDIHMDETFLTLYDPTLRDTFNAETNCGVGPWYLGIAKDLSPTSGCSILGIKLPSTEFDLVNLEIDGKGTPLLFLGQQDTDSSGRHVRPTSYQAPLAQCSVFPQQNNFNNQFEPVPNARSAPRSTGSYTSFSTCSTLFLLLALWLQY